MQYSEQKATISCLLSHRNLATAAAAICNALRRAWVLAARFVNTPVYCQSECYTSAEIVSEY